MGSVVRIAVSQLAVMVDGGGSAASGRVLIRGAVSSDASAVAGVYVESWNTGFVGLMPQRDLTQRLVSRWEHDLGVGLPWRWWVAIDVDDLVGFAGIGPTRDPVAMGLGELDTIAVRSSWWRRGVGRALMTVALRYLAADGYRGAVVWTLANYPRGDAFYRSAGWVPDGGIRAEGTQIRYRRPPVTAFPTSTEAISETDMTGTAWT